MVVVGERGREKEAEGRFIGQAEPPKYKVWTGAPVLPHPSTSLSLGFFSCSAGAE